MRWQPFAYVAGGIVAVIAIAAIALPFAIDVNRFKPQIATAVKDATGRDLVIQKDLAFALLPRPSIKVAGVSFSNAPWGSRPAMAIIGEVSAAVELLPLLRGRLEIGEIRLADVDVLLETDKTGRGNWDFGKEGGAKPAAPQPATELVLPDIADIVARNIRVAFRDGRSGKTETVVVTSFSALAGAAGALTLKAEAAVNGTALTVAGILGAPADLSANRPWPIKLDLSVVGTKLAIDGVVARPTEMKGIALSVRAEGTDLGLLSPLAGTPLPRSKPWRIAAQIKGEPAALAVSGLAANIGNNSVTGDVTLNLLGARPKIGGNVTLARLDPNDLPDNSANAAPTKKSDGRVIPDLPLDFTALRLVDLDINVSAPALAIGALTATEFATHVVLTDGELALKPLGVGLFDGKASGEATLSAKTGALAAKLALRRFAMGKLLAAAGAPAGLLEGPADYDLDVKGAGNNLRALLASLNGQTSLVMDSGKVGARYDEYLSADLLKILLPGGRKEESKLNCFVGRYDIRNGVVHTTGFLFDSDRATIQGEGEASLHTETLDFVFKPRPKDATLLSVALPVKVSGTFANPSVRPDELAVAKGVAGSVIGGAINPLGILIPLVTGGDRTNPCLAALAKPAAATAGKPGSAAAPADSSVGGFFRGLGRTIDRSVGR